MTLATKTLRYRVVALAALLVVLAATAFVAGSPFATLTMHSCSIYHIATVVC